MRFLYYHLLGPALLAGYRLFSLFNRKAKEFFEIRKGLFERVEEGMAKIGKAGPAVLFHAASVGETLMAMPVMAALRESDPDTTIVFCYTSSSVEHNMPRGIAADLVVPSPLDRAEDAARFLELVKPKALVFSTYDLWPGLLMEARERGVPAVMINASLPEKAGRLRFPARNFFSRFYSKLEAVGAATEADAARFPLLGVGPDRVKVTGNCRYDQTLARCRSVEKDDPDLAPLPDCEILAIAGSSWPEDHERLLPALAGLMKEHEEVCAAIAPHEPGEAHVKEVEDFFAPLGIDTVRYTRVKEGADKPGRVLVVDTVGVLYKLYRKGDIAYVGGSFKQGVHSVMEPAGMGLPVLVGPVHANSAEALEMISAGGAVSAETAEGLRTALERWVHDKEERGRAGRAALGVVEANAGATGRTLELVRKYL